MLAIQPLKNKRKRRRVKKSQLRLNVIHSLISLMKLFQARNNLNLLKKKEKMKMIMVMKQMKSTKSLQMSLNFLINLRRIQYLQHQNIISVSLKLMTVDMAMKMDVILMMDTITVVTTINIKKMMAMMTLMKMAVIKRKAKRERKVVLNNFHLVQMVNLRNASNSEYYNNHINK